ncbi:MAG TPA: ribosome biogenesis factor YjgA [Candidatus Acidoferrum sp.]|nr:ribosome biogenesis factor YjgA [Candidatus Acidoferrum sp.]
MRRKPDAEPAIRPNKSQLKRDSDALQALGEQLTQATPTTLAKCELPDKLLAAIEEYRRLPNAHGAQRRQLQFIGKVMRDVDEETIERIHGQLNLNVEMEKRRFHRIEQLRDALLLGDKQQLNDVLAAYPALDAQVVGQLLRQARKEAEQNGPPAAARKLFKLLRDAVEKQG